MAAFILPGECEASGLKFTFLHLLERVIRVTCVSSSRDLVEVLNFVLPITFQHCSLLGDILLHSSSALTSFGVIALNIGIHLNSSYQ